jgi:hypothetical protein
MARVIPNAFGLLCLSSVFLPAGAGYVSLSSTVQMGCDAYPAFYSVRTGVLSRGEGGWVVKASRLRMSGAIPLLPMFPSYREQGKQSLFTFHILLFFLALFLCYVHFSFSFQQSSIFYFAPFSISFVLYLSTFEEPEITSFGRQNSRK